MKTRDKNEEKEFDRLHDYFHRRNSQHSFINTKFNPEKEDLHHLQAVINDKFESKTFLFQEPHKKAANIVLPSCSALEESLLKSLEGRDDQDLHFDFDESCIEKCVQTGIRVMSDIAPINYEMKLRIGKM